MSDYTFIFGVMSVNKLKLRIITELFDLKVVKVHVSTGGRETLKAL